MGISVDQGADSRIKRGSAGAGGLCREPGKDEDRPDSDRGIAARMELGSDH